MDKIAKYLMLKIYLFLLLFINIEIVAAVYHVDVVAGNDANTGLTVTLAKKTINAAILVASSGDTIQIYPGIYPEKVIVDKSLTLTGISKYNCVLQGTFGATAADAGIVINPNVNDVVIKHITATNYHHGLLITGTGNNTNLTIDDCSFTFNNNSGIYFDQVGKIKNFTLINSRLTNNDNDLVNDAGRGLYANGPGVLLENLIIRNDTISYNRISGFDLNPAILIGLDGLEISGCEFKGINTAGWIQDASIAVSGWLPTPSTLYENKIVNNYCEMYGRFGIELKCGTGNGKTSGIGSLVVEDNYIFSSNQPYSAGATTNPVPVENRDRGGIVLCNVYDGGNPYNAVIRYNTVDGVRQSTTNFQFPVFERSTGYGIVVSGDSIKVLNNEIKNSNIAIQFQAGQGIVSACPNTAVCQAGFNNRFYGRDMGTTCKGGLVKNNVITSCTWGARNVGIVANTLNAVENYWGVYLGPASATYSTLTTSGSRIEDVTSTFAVAPFSSLNKVSFNPYYATTIDHTPGTLSGQRGVQRNVATPIVIGVNTPSHGCDNNPSPRSVLDEAVKLASNSVIDRINIEEGPHPGTTLVDRTIEFTNNGITPDIANLEINNTGIKLFLLKPLSISNSATFTNGIVKNNSSSVLIFQDNATHSGSSDLSFVDGPVKKIGNDSFKFPVGKELYGEHYISATAPDDASDAYTAEYFPSDPHSSISSSLYTPLNSISSCEYWKLDENTDLSVNNSLNVTLQLKAGTPCIGTSYPNSFLHTVVSRYDGSLWQNHGLLSSTGTPSLGTITSYSVTSFSPFTWGTFMNPLPDMNVVNINVPVSGNVNTNDDVPIGTTYGAPIASSSNPSACTPTMSANGTYTFMCVTPGVYTFSVSVCPPGLSVSSCITVPLVITVLDPGVLTNPPVVNPDASSTLVNTPVGTDVLANDACSNPGCSLNPGSVSVPSSGTGAPQHGTVSVNPTTGVITYTPSTGFTGQDTYIYTVCDNQTPSVCKSAQVVINVIPVNTGNTTNASDDYLSTYENTASVGSVILNDYDAEGNTQTVTAQTTAVAGGTLVLNSNGDYTFTPTPNYTGSVDFAYTICDNGLPVKCTNATLHVLVNPLPQIAASKLAGQLTKINASTYQVVFTFNIANIGTIAATNVQLVDNLAAAFISPTTYTVIGLNANTPLTVNTSYNGNSSVALLSGTNSLNASQNALVTLTVNFSPNTTTVTAFNNIAIASTSTLPDLTGGGIHLSSDTTDAGTNPDSDGDGNPNESGENDPTVFGQQIGAAKIASVPVKINATTFQTVFTFNVTNVGPLAATNVQLVDNLNNTFPLPITYTVLGVTANNPLTTNPAYNGNSTIAMLSGINTLNASQNAIVTLTVNFTPNTTTLTSLSNSGTVSTSGVADPTGTATHISTDITDDGINADTDGDGNPNETGENDPTIFGQQVLSDADGDGIQNNLDPDDDNDGLTDVDEGLGDFDGDGIPDALDLDSDNDGIPDTIENGVPDSDKDGIAGTGTPLDTDHDGLVDLVDPTNGGTPISLVDTDNDGNPNSTDLDADNDGVVDIVEAGGIDANNDGKPDVTYVDADGDGFIDVIDPVGPTIAGTPLTIPNTDGDGKPNFLDIDSDNDGITDVKENGGTDPDNDGEVGTGNNQPDTDNDGIIDVVDANNGGTALTTPDKDGDGKANYLDLDSDNDGIADVKEVGGLDPDGDGEVGTGNNQPDSDNDGLIDSVDPSVAGSTPVVVIDTDNDGKVNYLDLDSDNDGITDVIEAGGLDPDNDGKIGTGNNQPDTDGDGFVDLVDTNNSGTNLPLTNSDSDTKPNYIDIDSDNDGIVDDIEAQTTTGYQPPLATDSDNDGLDDRYDGTVAGGITIIPTDKDGDLTPDYIDLDSDNDTYTDAIEGWDTNNDGIANIIPSATDADNDGLDDAYDTNDSSVNPTNNQTPNSFPDIDNIGNDRDWREPLDTDKDGLGDVVDIDDDNDGIIDSLEEPGDQDGDGIPNKLDLDSDNDGITDVIEGGSPDTNNDGLVDNYTDTNHNGLDDTVENGFGNLGISVPDTDLDGTPDFLDLDSDNDGISDVIEGGGSDPDGDGEVGVGNNQPDTDEDGLVDETENGTGFNGTPVPDTDGDGTPDYQDIDSDGDGVNDNGAVTGINDENATSDCDGDGIVNYIDADLCVLTVPDGFSPNGDGVNDVLIIKGILGYPNNEFTVLNRWGNVVNKIKGYNNADMVWDGKSSEGVKFGGDDLPEGTYFYILELGQGEKPLKGYIYLNKAVK